MSAPALDGSAELRRLVASHRPARSSDGYPESVRQRAVAWARPLHEAGHSWGALSSALGLWRGTLKSWCEKAAPMSASGPWLPVSVTDEASLNSAPLVLVTPSGFRVENLGEDLLLRILRELA